MKPTTDGQARISYLYQLAVMSVNVSAPLKGKGEEDVASISCEKAASSDSSSHGQLPWEYRLASLYNQQLQQVSEKSVQRL